MALVVALLGATPASALSLDDTQLLVSEALVDRQPAARQAYSSPIEPCADRSYRLTGGRWYRTLKWSFRASSTPSGLARADALRVIRRSFANVVNARNDCGRPDRVSATAAYLGTTSTRPRCYTRDRRNVVGFRPLPLDVLARTCWWVGSGRIVEADIQINSNHPWATSLAGCSLQPMLEAVMTHEVGHAYGLGHVGELRHGRLTMSTTLDGPCNNQEASLGLGDVLGLEKLY